MKKEFDEKREIVRNLRPIDDALFEKLMEDIEVCQEILRVITKDDNLKVIKVVPQGSVKNLQGRSVRLDALCERLDGSFCNMEVQKADNDNHIKRVRYNASCVTANVTDTGTTFDNVPDVCIIYISRFDMFGAGKTIYHVNSVVDETGEKIKNGLREIYVNTEIDDGSDIAELMKCFEQAEIQNRKFPKLSKRVNEFKEEKGNEGMCKSIEDYANKRAKEAVKETVIRMLKNGKLTVEEISECVQELTIDEIVELKRDIDSGETEEKYNFE